MIRTAKTSDIPEIMELLEQVLYVHHVGRPDLFKEKGSKYTVPELEEIINDPQKLILVYQDDEGKVWGHCFCDIQDKGETSSTYARKTLYINDLCVDKDHRRQNIGRQLYEAAREWARKNRFLNVTLNVWSCNPGAMEFYKAIGMVPQSIHMEEKL